MKFFNREKFLCSIDQVEFKTYEDLISHMRQIHHQPIVKCHDCRKEFIHEKDRLHHVREEHEEKLDSREHKNLHERKLGLTPQEDLDTNRKNFSDNF